MTFPLVFLLPAPVYCFFLTLVVPLHLPCSPSLSLCLTGRWSPGWETAFLPWPPIRSCCMTPACSTAMSLPDHMRWCAVLLSICFQLSYSISYLQRCSVLVVGYIYLLYRKVYTLHWLHFCQFLGGYTVNSVFRGKYLYILTFTPLAYM